MESFIIRHQILISLVITFLLVGLGIYLLAFLEKIEGFAIMLLTILLNMVLLRLDDILGWHWVCLSCGNESFLKREKYCERCGSPMSLKKKETLKCPKGHKIKVDSRSSHFTRYCPKCGASLKNKE
jgi:ribosomal protein L37E